LAYSAYGEDGEVDQHINEPYETFKSLMSRFTLSDFDPDAFVRKAKSRGFRYIIPTTHHMDGFCLWDTKTSEFKMTNAPARMDVVGELIKACRKHGLKFGVYFPYCDLSHPLVQKLIPQGKGDSGQWSDQNPLPPGELRATAHTCRSRSVNCVRTMGRSTYSSGTPARPTLSGLEWLSGWCMSFSRAFSRIAVGERITSIAQQMRGYRRRLFYSRTECAIHSVDVSGACCSIRDVHYNDHNWLYDKTDRHFKSARSLTHALIEAVSKGGNLLVNIGPDTRGRVQPEVDAALDEMGAWVAKHTEPSGVRPPVRAMTFRMWP